MLLRVVLNVMLLPATTASTAEPEKAPLTLDEKKKKKQAATGEEERNRSHRTYPTFSPDLLPITPTLSFFILRGCTFLYDLTEYDWILLELKRNRIFFLIDGNR